MQLDLFGHIAEVYARNPSGAVPNKALYESAAMLAGIPMDTVNRREPVGEEGKKYSVIKRKMRWHQQTLKQMGLLERADRGSWRLTGKGKKQLTKAEPHFAMLGFSTNLGIAIWGSWERVFGRLDVPISLCVTSPPFLLRKPRAYGNLKDEHEYVDFIVRSMEPVVRNMVPGGSIALNLSNDVFEPGSPARSMYTERLLLALHDRLGLKKMDWMPWESNKAPGPYQWSSLKRVQLNVAYEHVFWMTNDPMRVRADNRRVLQAHTEKHLKLIQGGGEQRDAKYCDGAYTIRKGKSFAKLTAGKIPRNVLKNFGEDEAYLLEGIAEEFGMKVDDEAFPLELGKFLVKALSGDPVDVFTSSNLLKVSNTCANKRRLAEIARGIGLPVHGATMPLELAKFLIQFLTGEGEDELVVDLYGGWFRTALAAEELGRRWISCDNVKEYVRGGAEGFVAAPGFAFGKGFLR